MHPFNPIDSLDPYLLFSRRQSDSNSSSVCGGGGVGTGVCRPGSSCMSSAFLPSFPSLMWSCTGKGILYTNQCQHSADDEVRPSLQALPHLLSVSVLKYTNLLTPPTIFRENSAVSKDDVRQIAAMDFAGTVITRLARASMSLGTGYVLPKPYSLIPTIHPTRVSVIRH